MQSAATGTTGSLLRPREGDCLLPSSPWLEVAAPQGFPVADKARPSCRHAFAAGVAVRPSPRRTSCPQGCCSHRERAPSSSRHRPRGSSIPGAHAWRAGSGRQDGWSAPDGRPVRSTSTGPGRVGVMCRSSFVRSDHGVASWARRMRFPRRVSAFPTSVQAGDASAASAESSFLCLIIPASTSACAASR